MSRPVARHVQGTGMGGCGSSVYRNEGNTTNTRKMQHYREHTSGTLYPTLSAGPGNDCMSVNNVSEEEQNTLLQNTAYQSVVILTSQSGNGRYHQEHTGIHISSPSHCVVVVH